MKKLILASIFTLCFSVLTFAQSENIPCPKVSVQGPAGVSNAGDTMSFVAVVSEKNQNIEYEWTVEPELEFSGQGTSKIKVVSTVDLAGSNVIATVKIKGLSEDCKSEASDIGVIVPGCGLTEEQAYIGFNSTSLEDLKAGINGLFLQLYNNPDYKGLIIFERENYGEMETVNQLASDIRDYIKWRFKSEDFEKISFKVCNSQGYPLHMLVVPPNMEIPKYTGILKPEDCKDLEVKLK